jgi:hypothetical protein
VNNHLEIILKEASVIKIKIITKNFLTTTGEPTKISHEGLPAGIKPENLLNTSHK